jgi:hypothetical protein
MCDDDWPLALTPTLHSPRFPSGTYGRWGRERMNFALPSASGMGVSRDFSDLFDFSRVQNVTVIGGSGADVFGVLPGDEP